MGVFNMSANWKRLCTLLVVGAVGAAGFWAAWAGVSAQTLLISAAVIGLVIGAAFGLIIKKNGPRNRKSS
jgi:membrane associated rhomboid family serine protease